jgi:hypothetical protein
MGNKVNRKVDKVNRKHKVDMKVPPKSSLRVNRENR